MQYVNAVSSSSTERPIQDPAWKPEVQRYLQALGRGDKDVHAPTSVLGDGAGDTALEVFEQCPDFLEQVYTMFVLDYKSKTKRAAFEYVLEAFRREMDTYSGLATLQRCGAMDRLERILAICPWPDMTNAKARDIPTVLVLSSIYQDLARHGATATQMRPNGVEFVTMGMLLGHCETHFSSTSKRATKMQFVHLGSGNGAIVFAVSSILCSPAFSLLRGVVHKVVGVERSAQLVDEAQTATAAHERQPDHESLPHKLCFLREDFVSPESTWSSSPSIVFCNATSFPNTLMQGIAKQTAKLPAGSLVISVSRPIPHTGTYELDDSLWKIVWEGEYPMSWGTATLYIHERL